MQKHFTLPDCHGYDENWKHVLVRVLQEKKVSVVSQANFRFHTGNKQTLATSHTNVSCYSGWMMKRHFYVNIGHFKCFHSSTSLFMWGRFVNAEEHEKISKITAWKPFRADDIPTVLYVRQTKNSWQLQTVHFIRMRGLYICNGVFVVWIWFPHSAGEHIKKVLELKTKSFAIQTPS